jgi:hypothetical protein
VSLRSLYPECLWPNCLRDPSCFTEADTSLLPASFSN